MKFKSIPGYENLYEAAEDGTIWTVPGKTTYRMLNGTKQKRVWKQRQMKPKVEQRTGSKNRDYRVELWKNEAIRRIKEYLDEQIGMLTDIKVSILG